MIVFLPYSYTLVFFIVLSDQVHIYAGNVIKIRRTIELKKKTLKYTRTECYQSLKSALDLQQTAKKVKLNKKILNCKKKVQIKNDEQ